MSDNINIDRMMVAPPYYQAEKGRSFRDHQKLRQTVTGRQLGRSRYPQFY